MEREGRGEIGDAAGIAFVSTDRPTSPPTDQGSESKLCFSLLFVDERLVMIRSGANEREKKLNTEHKG